MPAAIAQETSNIEKHIYLDIVKIENNVIHLNDGTRYSHRSNCKFSVGDQIKRASFSPAHHSYWLKSDSIWLANVQLDLTSVSTDYEIVDIQEDSNSTFITLKNGITFEVSHYWTTWQKNHPSYQIEDKELFSVGHRVILATFLDSEETLLINTDQPSYARVINNSL
jgi:hypothetical protein